MQYLLFFSFLFPWFSLNPAMQIADNQSTIIIFIQKSDQIFIEKTLPQLKQFAVANGMQFIQKNAVEGVPTEITTTPAIVFQNWRGRSIYANRYTEFSTLKNFIRTSRVVPQRIVEDCRADIAIWENGRATIAAPIKITDVKGELPKGFQQADFKTTLKQVLVKKMTDFQLKNQSCIGKTDRLFYLDLHPYRDVNDDFYLSTEIYSQFNCKKPIYSQLTTPLKGKFSNWQNMITTVATQLEAEIKQQIKDSTIGDACSPIAKNVPTKTWEELNLTLPQPTDNQQLANIINVEMPTQWTYASGIDKHTPIVQFRFMPPLDRYIGEIKTISGDLNFSTEKRTLNGDFTAAMQSLTMGSEDFDYNVLNKYIKAYKIPESNFTFANNNDLSKLRFGETTNLTVDGTFTLMRKKHPVQVTAQLTPILDKNGVPLLQVSAAFELNIVDDFGIKGPDGPDPARKMMQFDLNFLLKAGRGGEVGSF